MNGLAATICICTHNGGDRLKRVIEALSFSRSCGYTWEILIVDNASTDTTKDVIEELAQQSTVSIRSVFEENLGISYARLRASEEAKGNIICFLDDDNFAGKGFVHHAVTFFEQHPKCGIVGGKIRPIWEHEPTELVKKVGSFALALCDHGETPFCYQGRHEGPVGAGMCIRKKLLVEIYKSSNLQHKVSGRVGKKLESGEDLAFCLISKNLGYECWYEPSIQLAHFIPCKRMQKDYLLKLYEGIGRGQAAVRKLYDWKARNPIFAMFIAFKDMVRWTFAEFNSPVEPTENSISERKLARDMKDLNQRLLRGRICNTILFSK